MNAARLYTARLLHRSWLSGKNFEIALDRPAGFEFIPGQSIRIVEGALERDFSVASGPREPRIMLCIRLIEQGQCTPLLSAAAPGTLLTFSGPHGFFTYREAPRPAIFAATGTGVAPFLSMTRAGVTGFTLLHGVRTADELLYERELRAAAARYVGCLSRDHARHEFAGRVTAWVEANLAPGTYDFYLCGNRAMIRDLTFLVDERHPGSHVYTEIFY